MQEVHDGSCAIKTVAFFRWRKPFAHALQVKFVRVKNIIHQNKSFAKAHCNIHGHVTWLTIHPSDLARLITEEEKNNQDIEAPEVLLNLIFFSSSCCPPSKPVHILFPNDA